MIESKDPELLCDTSRFDPVRYPDKLGLSSVNSLKNTNYKVGPKRNAYNVVEFAIEKIKDIKTFSGSNKGTCAGLLVAFILLILIFSSGRNCCKSFITHLF